MFEEFLAMLTVSHVADRYGVTTTFMVRALDQIGCRNLRPDSALSAATIARFESAFGEKIRAARPKSSIVIAPSSADAADHDLPLGTARTGSKPHVMRIAHEHHTGKRRNGYFEKALIDERALFTRSTPTALGRVTRGAAKRRPASTRSSSTTAHTPPVGCRSRPCWVTGSTLRTCRPTSAPGCVELVAAGKGFRDSPWEREAGRTYFCEAYLRLRIDGRVVVEECRLRDFHSGPHRTFGGATWDIGVDDYVPVSADSNRRITEAS